MMYRMTLYYNVYANKVMMGDTVRLVRRSKSCLIQNVTKPFFISRSQGQPLKSHFLQLSHVIVHSLSPVSMSKHAPMKPAAFL